MLKRKKIILIAIALTMSCSIINGTSSVFADEVNDDNLDLISEEVQSYDSTVNGEVNFEDLIPNNGTLTMENSYIVSHSVDKTLVWDENNRCILDNIIYVKNDDNTVSICGTNNMYKDLIIIQSSITINDTEYEVKGINDFAFSNCSSLNRVIINDGIETIGKGAFYSCENLSGIDLPSTITRLENNIFDKCSKLESLRIPDSVVSIADRAFKDCSNLAYISIPDSVTSLGDSVFMNCSNLESITLSDNITNIGDYEFYNCSSLDRVLIPEGVTSIGSGAFYNCSELTYISIPDTVTSMRSYAFYGCKNLNNIELSNNITEISECTFSGCSSLSSISIPDSVATVGNQAFCGCSDLVSLTIPNRVANIGEYAFANNSKLESLVIENNEVNIGSYVLIGCDNCKVKVKNEAVKNKLINCGVREEQIIMEVEDTDEPSEIIWGEDADTTWKEVTIQKSSAGIIYATYTVNRAEINGIVFESNIGSDRAYISRTSSNLINEDLNLPSKIKVNGKYYTVNSISDGAFYGCNIIRTISLPDTITSIGQKAFKSCRNLESIALSDNVSYIGGSAFEGCYSLKDAVVPGKVKQLYPNAIKGPDWNLGTFTSCKSLKNLQFQKGVEIIGTYTIHGCNSLENIIIPDTVNKLEYEALTGADNVKSIWASSSIYDLVKSSFTSNPMLIESNVYDRIDYIDDVIKIKADSVQCIEKLSNGDEIEIPMTLNEDGYFVHDPEITSAGTRHYYYKAFKDGVEYDSPVIKVTVNS